MDQMEDSDDRKPDKYQIIRRINKGRVNKCFEIEMAGKRLFMKTNDLERHHMFEIEAKNNNLLKSLGFNVPVIYSQSPNLIMELLISQPNYSLEHLADELKKLHSFNNTKFGMEYCSYNGNDCLSNEWSECWCDFFSKNRWNKIIDLITRNHSNNFIPCEFPLWIYGMKINQIISKILSNTKPCLLHGDMNPDNYIYANNKIYFIDLSCYYGDKYYDTVTLTMWMTPDEREQFMIRYGDKPPENVQALYQAYIYLSCYRHSAIKKFKTKALQIMDMLLSSYPAYYPDIIDPIYKKISRALENVILLVQCGSFNPIHKNHIGNLRIAAQWIAGQNYSGDVIQILVPATDQRIRSKCRNGFGLYDRYRMIQAVREDIVIDLSQLFGEKLIENYRNIYDPKKIFIVCGTDTLQYNVSHYPADTQFICIERAAVQHEPILCDRIIYLKSYEKQ